MEETQRWIADKLREIGTQRQHLKYFSGQEYRLDRRQAIFFDGCNASVWTVSRTTSAESDSGDVYESAFNLADVERLLKNSPREVGIAILEDRWKSTEKVSLAALKETVVFMERLLAGDAALAEESRKMVAQVRQMLPKGGPNSFRKYQHRRLLFDIFASVDRGNGGYEVLDAGNEVMRVRLGNALLHAVKLCRQQAGAQRQQELMESLKKPGDLF